LLHLFGGYQPGLLTNELTTVKDEKIGDTLHTIPRCKPGMAFGVNFEDDSLARHFLGGSGYFRRCHAAGAAPCRPEIHQCGHTRLPHDVVKKGFVHLDRLINRRQVSLARAAAPVIGEMRGRNAIVAATDWTSAYDRHGRIQ
jgi:hypothetical protein